MKTKILKIAGIALAILATLVWATPYIFKGKIIGMIRTQIGKDLRAHVDFSGADISLFRHFPKISIGLDNLQVICVGEFQDDTLLMARQVDIACDLRSLVSGHGIQVNSITVNEPRLHAVVHQNGHANWNITIPANSENTDSANGNFKWALQRYSIHNAHVEYLDEKKDLHIVMENLEQEAQGHFNSDQFTMKTKTTSDAVNIFLTGAFPYCLSAKTHIDVDFRVDNKTHTYTFNTDQVNFNDLKFHTEGYFQWINDSSYAMNIRYKVPSTNFKNILSMMPSVYQKDFASIESNGQVNFNGLIKGKYDEKHFPAYHANFYVINGYFKYPDLSVPVENINLGIQINNPDGLPDHASINVTGAHVKIKNDTIDLHLLVKNLKTKPFIDFAFRGKLDLADISKWMKMDSSTRISGLLTADMEAKGNIPETENQKKNKFQSSGELHLTDFSFISKAHPGGMALHELLMTLNPKNVEVKELNGEFGSSHISATGILDNFYDYSLRSRPLKASFDLKAGEVNLRDWTNTNQADPAVAQNGPIIIPANIDFTIHADAEKLHFDNLDLQDIHCSMLISDQTVHLQNLKAKGLDGDIALEGTYSTLESPAHPEISLIYDVKALDIQKTFLAFNCIRRIMPVAKFMTGNIDAHMNLNGKLNGDMTADLPTLQGEGKVLLLSGTLKDFGPMDKLWQTMDISALKDLPLTDVQSEFSFKGNRVIVNPFFVQTKDMEFDIEGTHDFDQALDYDVSLKVPRSDLGKKGKVFVKNVVEQAADKGIPVTLRDAVRVDIKMGGSINNPDVKTDMDAVVSNAATDLKKEVNAFVNAKLDSAKQQLHNRPANSKKSMFSQAAYKSRGSIKTKKTIHKTNKKTTHTKSKKKKKKPVKNYTTTSKKDGRTASN